MCLFARDRHAGMRGISSLCASCGSNILRACNELALSALGNAGAVDPRAASCGAHALPGAITGRAVGAARTSCVSGPSMGQGLVVGWRSLMWLRLWGPLQHRVRRNSEFHAKPRRRKGRTSELADGSALCCGVVSRPRHSCDRSGLQYTADEDTISQRLI